MAGFQPAVFFFQDVTLLFPKTDKLEACRHQSNHHGGGRARKGSRLEKVCLNHNAKSTSWKLILTTAMTGMEIGYVEVPIECWGKPKKVRRAAGPTE